MEARKKSPMIEALLKDLTSLTFSRGYEDGQLTVLSEVGEGAEEGDYLPFSRQIYGTIDGVILGGENRPESIRCSLNIEQLHSRENATEQALDELTGAVSKGDITRQAIDLIDNLHAGNTSIAIVDLDYFKYVNDHYGHQYGDEVLKTAVVIMKEVVYDMGSVGRIGGDEFFIIFHNNADEDSLRGYLAQIKTRMKETFAGKGPQGDKPISVSMGVARYPLDAGNYKDLFTVADYCLYLAKEKGRNRYIIYNAEKHLPVEEILDRKKSNTLINGRSDLALGDALSQMVFMIRYGETKPEPAALMKEFAERFHVPLLCLVDKEDSRVLLSAGEYSEEGEMAERICGALFTEELLKLKRTKLDFYIINNVLHIPEELSDYGVRIKEAGLKSFIAIPFKDAGQRERYLLLAAIRQPIFWNEQHHMYYRLFVDAFSGYQF